MDVFSNLSELCKINDEQTVKHILEDPKLEGHLNKLTDAQKLNLLEIAIQNGSAETVTVLLSDSHTQITRQTLIPPWQQLEPTILSALYKGHYSTIQRYAQKCDSTSSQHTSLLIFPTFATLALTSLNQLDMVQFLLWSVRHDRPTVDVLHLSLHEAILKGHEELVRLLLTHKSLFFKAKTQTETETEVETKQQQEDDHNEQEEKQQDKLDSPDFEKYLMLAIEHKQVGVVRVLVNSPLVPTVKSALFAQKIKNEEIIKTLKNHRALSDDMFIGTDVVLAKHFPAHLLTQIIDDLKLQSKSKKLSYDETIDIQVFLKDFHRRKKTSIDNVSLPYPVRKKVNLVVFANEKEIPEGELAGRLKVYEPVEGEGGKKKRMKRFDNATVWMTVDDVREMEKRRRDVDPLWKSGETFIIYTQRFPLEELKDISYLDRFRHKFNKAPYDLHEQLNIAELRSYYQSRIRLTTGNPLRVLKDDKNKQRLDYLMRQQGGEGEETKLDGEGEGLTTAETRELKRLKEKEIGNHFCCPIGLASLPTESIITNIEHFISELMIVLSDHPYGWDHVLQVVMKTSMGAPRRVYQSEELKKMKKKRR